LPQGSTGLREDKPRGFQINRWGKNLYSQFDKDYGNKINLGCPDYPLSENRRSFARPLAVRWMGTSYRSSHYYQSHSITNSTSPLNRVRTAGRLCTFYENG